MAGFPDGARVCFVGDSITAQYNYVARISAYYIENFKDSHIRIYNCGVAGGTAASQLTYLADDTLCHNPTHAVVMVGVNDSARWMLGNEKNKERYDGLVEAYERYRTNLAALCDALEKENIDITLCTPAPYAEYQPTAQEPLKGGYALIAGYADYCRELAEKRGYKLCDYHSYLTEKLRTETLYNDDHIHPNDRGHHYMAKCFLETQGLELGDEKSIPSSFAELRRVSGIIRDIFAVELMILHDYNMPYDEKMKLVREYVDNHKAPTPYFERISEQYLINKPQQAKYTALTEELVDELMG